MIPKDEARELLPCPFCGNKDIEYVPVRGVGAPEREPLAYCHPCNWSCPVRIWNTRPPKAVDELVDIIEAYVDQCESTGQHDQLYHDSKQALKNFKKGE